jgi:DNA-binding transcriptional MocR family regulator
MESAAWLPPRWSDHSVVAALARANFVALPLSALTLATPRPPALIPGYAGHGEAQLARAVKRMTADFDRPTGLTRLHELELSEGQLRP